MGVKYYDDNIGYAYSIKDVLAKNLEPSENLISFKEIDGTKSQNAIQLENIDPSNRIANEINELLDDIESVLDSIESDRFKTGDEARENRQYLVDVRDNLSEFIEEIKKFADQDIKGLCDQYNQNLKTYSNDMKMKLLKERADQIDDEAIRGVGKLHPRYPAPEIKTVTTSVYDDSIRLKDGEGPEKNVYTKETIKKSEVVGTDVTYTVEVKKYKYINYWMWFKLDFWPFNIGDIKDVNTFEEKFADIGEELPYQK